MTATATTTATPTRTRVPEGGACMDSSECEPGSSCLDQICTWVAAPAPALSPSALLDALALLIAGGGLALRRRRRDPG